MDAMDNNSLNSWHVSPNLLKRETMMRLTVDRSSLMVIKKYSHIFLYISHNFSEYILLYLTPKVEGKFYFN
jgi:hypothetical protein